MRSLSVNERKLLIIQFFDILAYSLASIFVTVFFFVNSDLKTTTAYRIITFASMTFFYTATGWSFRKLSSGSHVKVGLFASASYYFLLFFLREKSIQYLVPIAILDGFAGGWYWAGFNINQYILSHSGRRVSYFGWGSALVNLAQVIGPVAGGLIITLAAVVGLSITGGYTVLFLLVALIIGSIALLIGKLPEHEIPSFRYRHITDHTRSREWKLVLTQQGLYGLYDVALGTVSSILVYTIIKQEAQLGAIFGVAAGIAMLSSLLVIKILTKLPLTFWIGSVGTAAAIALFALYQNPVGIVLFIAISVSTAPFLQIKLSTMFFEAMDHAAGTWQEKYHFLLEQNIVLGVLRTASYVGLYVFLLFGNEITLARAWLFVLPVIPLVIGALLHKTKRTFV